jgi:hypothetical protein
MASDTLCSFRKHAARFACSSARSLPLAGVSVNACSYVLSASRSLTDDTTECQGPPRGQPCMICCDYALSLREQLVAAKTQLLRLACEVEGVFTESRILWLRLLPHCVANRSSGHAHWLA